MKLNPNAADILNNMSNEDLVEGMGHAIIMFTATIEDNPILTAALLVFAEGQKRIAALDK